MTTTENKKKEDCEKRREMSSFGKRLSHRLMTRQGFQQVAFCVVLFVFLFAFVAKSRGGIDAGWDIVREVVRELPAQGMEEGHYAVRINQGELEALLVGE